MKHSEEEHIVLVNQEGQYSIWFVWKKIPHGWKQVGPRGSKENVLNYIKEVWKDMRPKSLKEQIDKVY